MNKLDNFTAQTLNGVTSYKGDLGVSHSKLTKNFSIKRLMVFLSS